MHLNFRRSNFSILGVLFTLAVTIGFCWASVQWISRHNLSPEPTVRQMKENELSTFRHLQKIVQAQREYRKRDWDGDGRKGFARFLVHLWRSVDREGKPVPVNLVSRELGFAMGPSLALDGYYFRNLEQREISLQGRRRAINSETEWITFAIPAQFRKTGFLFFLADQSGKIYAKYSRQTLAAYPYDLKSAGWKRVDSSSALKDLQAQHAYSR